MTGLQRHLLFLIISINVAVNFGDMPKWIPSLGLLFVCWRWLADLYQIPCPGRWTAALLAALASAGIWAEFGKIIGDPASSALLIVMVSLKVFEIKGYRDLMVVTYLCFLLLMAKLLNGQTIASSIFLIADSIAIISLMYLYHFPAKQRGIPWKPAAKLVLVSFPLIAVLFVLFPRFNFSLFNREQEAQSKTGFSGQLRPGMVSKLAQNNQVAFRAFFKSSLPPPLSRLYWRGAVLQKSEGMNWDPSASRKKFVSGDVTENIVEVMIEEGGSNWVFTIDYPHHLLMGQSRRQASVEEGGGHTYFLRAPLMSKETYQFSYSLDPKMSDWDQREINAARAKKDMKVSDEVKDLIKSWQAKRGKPDEAIRSIREYFIDNQFAYTLTPPEIKTIDDFLFRAKKGFCEHFASTTAELLQLLDVPARVVVGYQGASPSLAGDYLIVYQRDAHAWLEYWDSNRNIWLRLDPTSWIAMDRLTLGSEEFYRRQNAAAMSEYYNNPIAKIFGVESMKWLSRASLFFDQAEVYWTTFLIRYDFSFQKDLLETLGAFHISRLKLSLLLLFFIAAIGFFSLSVMRFRKRKVTEPSLWLYQVLLKKLADGGLKWSDATGPLKLKELAVEKFPQAKEGLEAAFQYITDLRYGNGTYNEREAGQFRRNVRLLNLDTTVQQD